MTGILFITHLFELELFGLISNSVSRILSLVHCIGEVLVILYISLMNLLVECNLAGRTPMFLELVLYYLSTLLLPFGAPIGLMPFASEHIIQEIVIH